MNVGTRTLLFGTHQFLIHPLFVTRAWHQVHGSWPSWREMVCIIVHDWGYWGSPELDGLVGKEHPVLGAKIAKWLLGPVYQDLCLFHSGTMVEMIGALQAARDEHGRPWAIPIQPSPLWAPDKLSITLYPKWLYLFLAGLSGEMAYYRRDLCLPRCNREFTSDSEWYDCMIEHIHERLANGQPAPGMTADAV